jgi:hypothetical protein
MAPGSPLPTLRMFQDIKFRSNNLLGQIKDLQHPPLQVQCTAALLMPPSVAVVRNSSVDCSTVPHWQLAAKKHLIIFGSYSGNAYA